MPAIAIKDLYFRWRGAEEFALQIPELCVESGEKIFIYGASGSGKSTLLNLVAGILRPQQGSIRLLDCDFSILGERARDRFRACHIGLVFQQFNLIPWLDVATNIRLACSFAGKDVNASQERMAGLLESLHLDPVLLRRPAVALSVGQQQRVAIARALINAPELLIVDEASSALDTDARDSFVQLLLQIQEQHCLTVLFVSHDRQLAKHFPRMLDIRNLNQTKGVGADAA
jgi:putative ABC transport system ATP-binding protein